MCMHLLVNFESIQSRNQLPLQRGWESEMGENTSKQTALYFLMSTPGQGSDTPHMQ